jgi:hypothetical protein
MAGQSVERQSKNREFRHFFDSIPHKSYALQKKAKGQLSAQLCKQARKQDEREPVQP